MKTQYGGQQHQATPADDRHGGGPTRNQIRRLENRVAKLAEANSELRARLDAIEGKTTVGDAFKRALEKVGRGNSQLPPGSVADDIRKIHQQGAKGSR